MYHFLFFFPIIFKKMCKIAQEKKSLRHVVCVLVIGEEEKWLFVSMGVSVHNNVHSNQKALRDILI